MKSFQYISKSLRKAVGITGVAWSLLWREKGRSIVAVLGVTIAVLSVTLLASTGIGVVQFGEEKLETADQDIWITHGPLAFTTTGGGGFRNTIQNSTGLVNELEKRDGVSSAIPMAFESVYIGTDPSNLSTIIGVGMPGIGGPIQVTKGSDFSRRNYQYRNESENPREKLEVIVDEKVAERYGLQPGDNLYMGGSVRSAGENNFTVIGVTPTISQFLGTPTVTTHIGELHRITGQTSTKPATFITVNVDEGVDTENVAMAIKRDYPEYDVRTSREQISAILESQVVIISGAAVIVVLAISGGTGLTAILLMLYVHQMRREFSALNAIGISDVTLSGLITVQALFISAVGGLLAVSLTPMLVGGVNEVAFRLTGFPDIAQTPVWISVAGMGIAIFIGLISAFVASRRLDSVSSVENLN